MADLTSAERETHISMTADDHGLWTIGTDDPYWQRRLERVGATVTRTRGDWREYSLPANQFTLRNKRELTDEQRARLSERGKHLNASR